MLDLQKRRVQLALFVAGLIALSMTGSMLSSFALPYLFHLLGDQFDDEGSGIDFGSIES